jgi:predicted nucleotidyltransferase
MPMTEDIIRETVQRHYPDVQAVYLYGSHGTPNQWPQSDVDAALLLPYPQGKTEPPLALSPCRAALEEALGRPADLVNLRTANTVFQNEVVTTGRRIVVQDAGAMHAFEGLALSFLLKLNEERREILEEFARTKRAYDV